MTTAESQRPGETSSTTRIRAIQLAIQEFQFQIESSIIDTNIKFIIELLQVFTNKPGTVYLEPSRETFEKAKLLTKESLCDKLDATKPLVPESEEIHAKKIFIELIHLGVIKAFVTLRLEKKAVEIDISDPGRGFGVFDVLYTFLSNVASITNSPLSFTELMLVNVFQSQDMIVKQIVKNYARQGMT